ncbi:TOBE domain-containing protein [Rhizobium lusitanum]|uniref:Transport-associated OB type 1 domain-containing protein n=1 Tax=Rhizobium lusitanum TaxID=293958 RepID=A0A7X0IPD1_9HYPH|nr:TOBE domain-containing protein [Rhizobium lusitanum]MBB6484695.1 hypothetical protein [Rhizobium lusitanum]
MRKRIGDEAAGVRANVIIIEPTDSETHLQLQAGDQSIVAAVRDRPPVSAGQPIQFRIDPAKAHLWIDWKESVCIDRRLLLLAQPPQIKSSIGTAFGFQNLVTVRSPL